ncbi:MAG: hypothetical protein IJH43_02000 [Mogibacterium sp.]|nr:hypothetical protein [Mogibacterium sp.]
MKAVVTLRPSESKRLIAKAVADMDAVQKAWDRAYMLIADGTTNAFIKQELVDDRSIGAGGSTIGLSTAGLLCVNIPKNRKSYANVFYKGKPVEGRSFAEALADHHSETVVIKGANAIDPDGNIGIITTGFDGGTIPRVIGPITSKGITFITPVGLEKLVPSVPQAAKAFNGAQNIDITMGAAGGMFVLTNTIVITEIEAAKQLFDIEGTLVAAGGIGGNEGAVTMVFEGNEENIKGFVEFLEKEVKGEPAIKGIKGECKTCRYQDCRYSGLDESEQPEWMKL